jgi:hypothetical protein
MKAKHQQKLKDDLEIITAKSVEEIENIRPIWGEMQSNEPYPLINADIDRYLSVVKAIKGNVRPHVMLFTRGGRPEAMAIGRIEDRRLKIEFGYKTLLRPMLRCLTVVHGGLIGRFSKDLNLLLVRELINALRRHEADMVFLLHLRTDLQLYQIARSVPGFLCVNHCPVVGLHWQTHLPDTVEEFYSKMSKTRKRNLKRYSRKLEQAAGGKLEVKCYNRENQLDYFMRVASAISGLTYKKGLNVAFSDTFETRSLLTQAARAGWWRGYILYAGDEPCAFESGISYERVYFGEHMGYNPRWGPFSPGTILLTKIFEDLCRNSSINVFDYDTGNAAYKDRFGTKCWSEACVYIFAPRLYPILTNVLRSSVMGLSLRLEGVLNRFGLLCWIKRRWRNLFEQSARKVRTEVRR